MWGDIINNIVIDFITFSVAEFLNRYFYLNFFRVFKIRPHLYSHVEIN